MARFNKLDVPHQWKDEFTKYPHGYIIFEAISKWVDQINKMITNINQWNEYLGGFTSTFGEVPQQMVELRQEMTDLIESVNSDLNTITDEVTGLAETLLSHLSNYSSYLASELGEEHIIRSLPNGVKDEISDGKLIKRVSDEVIIDGNLNWTGLVEGINTYRIQVYNWITDRNIYLKGYALVTNTFIAKSNDGDYSTTLITTDEKLINTGSYQESLYVRIEKTKVDAMVGATIIDKWKAYLNQYPITLTYQLAEPEIIDLPEVMTPNTMEIVRLSEQVDKLMNLP